MWPRSPIEKRAGPSPDRLWLGSEGALGVITEAWVRLQEQNLSLRNNLLKPGELEEQFRRLDGFERARDPRAGSEGTGLLDGEERGRVVRVEGVAIRMREDDVRRE